jgi:hypothetical protein
MQGTARPVDATGPYRTAAQAVHSLLQLARKGGELSPDFWHDGFVLGFLFHFIHGIAVQAGADPGDYSEMPNVYRFLCGNDGIEVLERSTALRLNDDSDYRTGGDAAERFLDVIHRRRGHEHDADVIQARQQAAEIVAGWDGPNRPEADNAFFACLLEAAFLNRVWHHVTLPSA